MKKRKYNGIHKLLFVHFTKNHTNFWKYTALHPESIWQKLQIGHLGSSSVKYGETRGISRCILYFFYQMERSSVIFQSWNFQWRVPVIWSMPPATRLFPL